MMDPRRQDKKLAMAGSATDIADPPRQTKNWQLHLPLSRADSLTDKWNPPRLPLKRCEIPLVRAAAACLILLVSQAKGKIPAGRRPGPPPPSPQRSVATHPAATPTPEVGAAYHTATPPPVAGIRPSHHHINAGGRSCPSLTPSAG